MSLRSFHLEFHVQQERTTGAVGDCHGDLCVQPDLPLEDAAGIGVEGSRLDQLAARLAGERRRVVDGAVSGM